jgi:iron(III) transport system permease protein
VTQTGLEYASRLGGDTDTTSAASSTDFSGLSTTHPSQPSQPRLRPWGRALRWSLVSLVIGAALASPAAALLVQGLRLSPKTLAHLWRSRLPSMLATTALLVIAVLAVSCVLGVFLAWLVASFDFPLRKIFSWTLALPLAIPAYVLGFAYASTFDYAGPFQSALRRIYRSLPGLADSRPPYVEVRGVLPAAFVLTLALYPYVYLLARAGLAELSPRMIDVAKTLGLDDRQVLLRLVVPMLRPHVAAAAALVAMETLTDFATVRIFNVETLADGMIRTWFDLGDRASAMTLATVLLLAGACLVFIELRSRRKKRFFRVLGGETERPLVKLLGKRAAAATLFCGAVIALSVIGPVSTLLAWASKALGAASVPAEAAGSRYAGTAIGTPSGTLLDHVRNSVTLGVAAALICTAIAALLANIRRLVPTRLSNLGARAATIGYAVPGAVVAAGTVVVLAAITTVSRRIPWLGSFLVRWIAIGSVGALLFGYSSRFMAVSYQAAESGLTRIAPSMTMVARTLGMHPARAAIRVHLPLMRPSLLVGALLVFVDVQKELPITLLLRPFGMDTLAVWVWRNTSVSVWEPAAVPALCIVGISLLAVSVVLAYLSKGETLPT